MSTSPDKVEELLVQEAIWGLDTESNVELQSHLQGCDLDRDSELHKWETTASAATVAMLGTRQVAVRDTLMTKLQADALAHFARQGLVSVADVAIAQSVAQSGQSVAGRSPRRRFWIAPWAAAAVLIVSLFLIWQASGGAAPSPDALRERLLRSGETVLSKDWIEGPSARRGNPEGNVVWSDQRQEGFMLLRGLPVNQPDRQQYQLWIVDADRSGPPIDGGVFDIPAGIDQVVIPVDAKLVIGRAAEFVITLEDAGGVVESAQREVIAKTFS